MISLTSKPNVPPLYLITLPSYCMPSRESDDLVAKREAQLEWMRANGLTWLGDPEKPVQRKIREPQRRPLISPVRLVSNRAPEASSAETRPALDTHAGNVSAHG